jgi:hypothetical protein
MAHITFTNTFEVLEFDSVKEFAPKPAFEEIPDWYKRLNSYINEKKAPMGEGQTSGTLKRCMPVFDSIVQGYIIYTYTDIFVSKKELVDENGNVKIIPWYEWPSFNAIGFHPIEQAPEHPKSNNFSYPKLMNPWAIKTPPGYSTLFMPPVHRDNPLTILPGVVDTDTYTAAVNFPMVLTDVNFEGLIPIGTPIAQVVPFRREPWEMVLGNQEDFIEQKKISQKLRLLFFDYYKTQFRQVKEYR